MLRIILIILLAGMLAGCAPDGGETTVPATDQPVTQTNTSSATPSPTQDSNPWAPRPGDDALTRGSVFIDSSDILILESYPPRFRLVVKGSLPTPCHQLRAVVAAPDANDRIAIEMYSLVKPGAICAQVLEPFTATINLDGAPSGQYSVWLNGSQVGEIIVPEGSSRSFKGWELYSWQEHGVFSYALLEGTNRLKTLEEIQKAEVRLANPEEVKAALAHLAPGEAVYWDVLDYGGGELPPQAVRDDIAAFAAEHGLELHLPPYTSD